jgi:hypothetical protein
MFKLTVSVLRLTDCWSECVSGTHTTADWSTVLKAAAVIIVAVIPAEAVVVAAVAATEW